MFVFLLHGIYNTFKLGITRSTFNTNNSKKKKILMSVPVHQIHCINLFNHKNYLKNPFHVILLIEWNVVFKIQHT